MSGLATHPSPNLAEISKHLVVAQPPELSSKLRGELLNPESWSSTLGRFGRTMNVAVALTGVDGVLLGECQNPQPVWLSVQRAMQPDRNACPFCVPSQTRCTVVADALHSGKVLLTSDRIGLAHVAAPLSLEGQPLGALIAGQVFVDFPQPLPLRRLARELNVSAQTFWPLAIQRPPLRAGTLHMFGELLDSLGHAFVRELYAHVLARRLQRALEEKTVLLQEVHHRVKNNLAVISSLLNMQAASADNPEVSACLLESQGRVSSMAAIHEHLYRSENLKQIRFDEYAGELAKDLRDSYSFPGNIHIEIDIGPVELDIRQALPCGLILNELLTNAFKYAFPKGRSGLITVSFSFAKPGYSMLSVQDDGVGLPADFQWLQPRSLGLRIVQVLSSQLSGTIEVNREAGTRFTLTFPTEKAPLGDSSSGKSAEK